MDYEVLPEFMNQSEQRVGGFLTVYQVVGGLAMVLPGMIVLQASAWNAIWFLPLVGLVVAAVSPAEGTLRYNLWLMPFMASIPGIQPVIRNWRPFRSLGQQTQATTPLYVGQGGQVVISADVAPDF